jgi:hypothetical protein
LVPNARTLRSCPLRHAAVEPGRVGPLLPVSTIGAKIAMASAQDDSHLAVGGVVTRGSTSTPTVSVWAPPPRTVPESGLTSLKSRPHATVM